jgi:integrase
MTVMKRAGSPNWFIEFSYKGQTVRKTSGVPLDQVGGKKEAKEVEARWRAEIDDEIKTGRTQASLSVAMTRYFNVKIKPNDPTGEDYFKKMKKILAHFGPDTLLADITSQKIADWAEGMQAGGLLEHRGHGVWKANKDRAYKPRSINAYLACLRAVLKKAASPEWNLLKAAPEVAMVDGKKPKLRFLDADEAMALVKAALPDKSANTDSLHLQQLIRFLLGTGARKSEALNLTWRCVELAGNGMASVRFEDTKTDVPRTVPVGDTLRDMLIEMRAAQQAAGYTGKKVFVYLNGQGEWMEIKGVSSSFLTARAKAGLGDDVTLHTLRHTYASWLAQDDVSMAKIAVLLGHSTVTTTQLYAHLAPRHLESSVSVLEHRMLKLEA